MSDAPEERQEPEGSHEPQEAGESAGGSAAGSSGAGPGRYTAPAVAGGVVAAVAAVLILPVLVMAGEPFAEVGECEDLFTEGFVAELHLDGVRVEELERDAGVLPLEDGLACGDVAGGSLSAVFTVLDPGSEPWDYSGAEERIAGRRESVEQLRSGAEEQRPFNMAEVEEIEAGDGGFVALYEPPAELGTEYREWTPTERGRSHATAFFRLRNVVVRVRSFDDGEPAVSGAPLGTATRVAEGLAERIPEVGEEGDPEPDDTVGL
ncbi:hypothetical protein [Streptomonospora salina]|uniref:Uncharacterized protein n=1 Tax=Streptomonospora salina TaxID=104205 RepID=A0A841E7C9_9ACTN|nr:hypothetical protein [Streptomonospora salina]MBB5997199.1 hypothetical protein [Streptomonospora salina]